jgi:uncharacterized LabA/DUF88 family protein
MVTRVMVFVDFWNFQLRLNYLEARRLGLPDVRFKVDWKNLGPLLARTACTAVQITEHSFEGVTVYTSFNPSTEEGKRFHHWAATWLGKQPGVRVEIRERKPRNPPRCPNCHLEILACPLCMKRINATIEKGVDTLIATDMIRLAWEEAYDIAVLATSDADLIPAVDFLRLKARKVIQAGFPPAGAELATACWASFDVFLLREELLRI